MKTLLIDTRQQDKKHELKDAYFKKVGIPTLRSKLPFGDYSLVQDMSVVVDTKRDLLEICGNLCSSKAEHERIARECDLAKENNVKMYILIEDDGGYVDKKQTIYNKPCTCIDDVFSWKNPRLFIWQGGKQKYPRAIRGKQLAKVMASFEKSHGCEFVFCSSKDAGAKVLELLGIDTDTI